MLYEVITVFEFAVKNKLTLLTLQEKQQNLESVFQQLTQDRNWNNPLRLSRIILNNFFFIPKKALTFVPATWKDLRLIATTEKNAKAIVLYLQFTIHIPAVRKKCWIVLIDFSAIKF